MAFVRDPNNIIPIMTSNTTPSGVAFASVNNNIAFQAFNGEITTAYVVSTNVVPCQVGYDFATGVVVYGYNISSNDTFGIKSWRFEGWNGTGWVVLDTRTNITSWQLDLVKKFTFSNTTKYSKYQLNILVRNSSLLIQIAALEMLGSIETPTQYPQAIGGF